MLTDKGQGQVWSYIEIYVDYLNDWYILQAVNNSI